MPLCILSFYINSAKDSMQVMKQESNLINVDVTKRLNALRDEGNIKEW